VHTRWTHARGVFGPWWLTVNTLWTLISSADTVVNKYGTDILKSRWNSLWITPKWGWSVWFAGFCLITVGFAFEWSFRQIRKLEKEPERPFLTMIFPLDQLLPASAALTRLDYIFLRNMGRRTAFDIGIADLTHTWNGNTYVAKFPRIQLLEPNVDAIPITPEVSLNGEVFPPHSMQARIWFCALLVGEDEQLREPSGMEVLHNVSMSYTDQGAPGGNSLELSAIYKLPGVFVVVRNQH
jgi:hypothetical protein